jgi:hypothetical protein
MCGKNFKNVDHINCKIIAFKREKRAFFAPYKIKVGKIKIHCSKLRLLILL